CNEPHIFLACTDKNQDQVFIYDPANPIVFEKYHYPSIFVVSKNNFEAWLEKAQSGDAYLEAQEELTGQTRYYGVGRPNSSFLPEKHVVNKSGENFSQNVAAPVLES
ncbi:MAG: hypothetical protein WBK77_09920, partial [Alphaproteobacteria bacterium]